MSDSAAHGPARYDALRTNAEELLETQPHKRVEYIHDGALTIVALPGFSHARIVRLLTRRFDAMSDAHLAPLEWDVRSENFQFELADNPNKYFIPDLAVAYPGATSNRQFRENLVMVVEVTSPKSPETVKNDHGTKRKQYAKNGVPCYLLVDQAERSWTVHVLEGEWPGYRVHSHGRYGEAIKLPEPFGFAIPTDEWPPYTDEG